MKKKKRGEYSERKKAEENGKIWWEKKEFRNEAKLLIERGKNMKKRKRKIVKGDVIMADRGIKGKTRKRKGIWDCEKEKKGFRES